MVKINPREISGNWLKGYALDLHTIRSQFLGSDEYGHEVFDTERSQIGELLYELKYKSNKTVLKEIVETSLYFIRSWKIDVDCIISVPPSKTDRSFQPVIEIATRIGSELEIPIFIDTIQKTRDTSELKNIFDFSERLKLIENAFAIKNLPPTSKNILLFDDLYRSGATLNAITSVLYKQGNAKNVYVLTLTKTRSKK